MAATCGHSKSPKNLKDALDFVLALSRGNHNRAVVQAIEKRVKQYCDEIYDTSYLETPTNNLRTLRLKLIDTSSPELNNIIPQSLECLPDVVSTLFPILYTTLFYFWFNVNDKNNGGGAWEEQQCSNSTAIHKWLKGSNGLQSAKNSPAKVWCGGFGNELKLQKGKACASALGDCVGDGTGDKLRQFVGRLLFYKPCFPELTSFGLVFIRELCKCVIGADEDNGDGKPRQAFQNALREQNKNAIPNYTGFEECCQAVKISINNLIGQQSGGSAHLHIPENSHTLYKNKLKYDNFNRYLTWLSEHLPNIIKHLEQMKDDCQEWSLDNVATAEDAGPFPYGFGFPKGGNWDQDQSGQIKSGVRNAISTLSAEGSGTLRKLLRYVNQFTAMSASTSPAGSIVGTTLTLGALGGGAAAVYFNIGGAATFLNGLLNFRSF
ncbi:secreted antigen 1 [Babesia caballi]|uniref:Secreted antigen 1 n=1 Tax=Babesia caballi TaxID=5871 RepID=A0AAV4LXE2_BABCB|nr:secreted antigen 1 [Babesia caballi]